MPLKLYNTLSGKKEVFKPRHNRKVNLFVCGVTSYDFAHLGHARTYIFFDFFSKYLKEKGYKVFYLQNITDIDDKIINRANQEKIHWKKLSRRFEKEYLNNMKKLRVNSVTKYARATDHIKEILSQVERLISAGYAYCTENGVYYDISKFRDYGKLSGRKKVKPQDAVSRIDESKVKKNKGDFCLWKLSKPNEPWWISPWGKGRPGWHIEDTAITETFFGPQYDIHGGGMDLIFPHHEAEIAQMEAISKKPHLVKYWLHTGFLTVAGKKMSKSLGNFITIKNFLKKNSARLLRYFILKHHYRSPLNYSDKLIKQSAKELSRLDELLNTIKQSSARITKGNNNLGENFRKECEKVLDDDLNTPKLIALIFKLLKKAYKLILAGKLSNEERSQIVNSLITIDKYVDFIFWREKKRIPVEVVSLVKEREKYRLQKRWKEADDIRNKIKKLGFWVEDTKSGPRIKAIQKKK